jgi:hypothetical protein
MTSVFTNISTSTFEPTQTFGGGSGSYLEGIKTNKYIDEEDEENEVIVGGFPILNIVNQIGLNTRHIGGGIGVNRISNLYVPAGLVVIQKSDRCNIMEEYHDVISDEIFNKLFDLPIYKQKKRKTIKNKISTKKTLKINK